jgi:hypothetical protein
MASVQDKGGDLIILARVLVVMAELLETKIITVPSAVIPRADLSATPGLRDGIFLLISNLGPL